MTTNNIIHWIITGGLATAVVYLGIKEKKMSDKYEQAIDNIANNLDITVDNEIIHEAVERAVDRETSVQVNTACTKAVSAVKGEINSQVAAAVRVEQEHLKEDTKKAIEKKIANIDISKAREEVIKEAQEIVADRLEKDTEAIKGTYEASIKKVSEMCENMISAATVSASKVKQPVSVGDVKTIIKLFEEV